MAQERRRPAALKELENSLLSGKRFPDKILPAMPIRVQFSPVERDIWPEGRGTETIFNFRVRETSSPHFDSADAYMLREWFEKIRYPEEALPFLRFVGDFVLLEHRSAHETLSWREFQRWQVLIRWLRLRKPWDGFLSFVHTDEDCKESLKERLEVFPDLCGPEALPEFVEQIWRVTESTLDLLRGYPSGLTIMRDMYLARKEIERIFSTPESREPESPDWQKAERILQRKRYERASGNSEGKQRLIGTIFAASALDAILATIYIDQLQGLETEVCALKDCQQVFVRTSKHERWYCCQACAHHASVLNLRPGGPSKQKRRKGKKGKGK